MWPCCDITSSDDDEHNTDSNFLLLFADVTPTLLEGLTEVDVLHIALGCRFALEKFTISQRHSLASDHEPLPHDPELFLFSALTPHRPSRSSHSWSSYSAAASRLLLPSRLSYRSPFHSWTLLCRRLHLVTPHRMCPHRRLINRSPRYFSMWQCRRLPTVSTPHLWTLPCRRSHTVLFLRLFLRKWVLALLPRSLLMCLFRLQYAVMCYTMFATQLPLTEFFVGCIYSNDPLDRQNFVRQSPPSVQGPHALLHPPEGLEQPAPPPDLATYSHLLTTHGASTISVPSHALQPPVSTTHVGTHPVRSQLLAPKEVLVPALAGTHNPVGSDPRTGTGLFPKPWALVLPMVKFGQPKSDRLGHIDTVDSDLMHHQFRLSLLQWNPGPARRNPTNIVSAACGKFHAVILQEASDHVPHISDQFRAYTDNMDLAILLNKDTFEPDPIVLKFKADSTSKSSWGMVLLIVRGLLRRPSLSSSPTVTFCSVHIHNVVAKKRDASTELLQFLHAKMLEHNVDFIGGHFNMSAVLHGQRRVLGSRVFYTWSFVSVGTWCVGRTAS